MAGAGTHDWLFHPIQVLLEQGHQVTLFCAEGSAVAARAQQTGVPVRAIDLPKRLNDLRAIVRTIVRLRRIFQIERPDVVYYFMSPVSLWARIAAWLARVPVRVYKPCALWDLDIPLYRFMEAATAWMDTAILASCRALESFYRRFPWTRKKTILSYYGTPQADFDPSLTSSVRQELHIGPHNPVVVTIAYLVPPFKQINPRIGIKGHEILIRAARVVVSQNPRVRFLIVGDEPPGPNRGAYAAQLEQMVQELGLTENVIFTGYRPDVPQILAAADFAVVPSISENVGGAVQPLLMEKPVVASNVGGLPDVVIDGETGFLAPPADAEALAEVILSMLALSPDQRRAMGRAGRELVKDLFDIRRIVDREIALYERILSNGKATWR